MNAVQLVENAESSEFYPTPPRLVQKMLEEVDLRKINTVLEPSAGKGDIIRGFAKKAANEYSRYCDDRYDVDCVEIDPNLRQILKYNFSEERKSEIHRRQGELENRRNYSSDAHKYVWASAEDKAEHALLEEELKTFIHGGIHVVHDDFLTFEPFKQYDLIIGNPPFSVADRHLLKALEIQRDGGKIVFLVNAETIRNPYTETRKELIRLLNTYGASIEFEEGAFMEAERKTNVEVAIIKVDIPAVQEESEIYNRMKEAEAVEDFDFESRDLDVTDVIKSSVNLFRVEVKAGIELIRQYRAMMPYMIRSFETKEVKNADGTISREYVDTEPILKLKDTYDRCYNTVSVNEYLKAVRLKYWIALVKNPKFVSKLTSKLQQEYYVKVSKLAAYDYTEYNIYTLLAEMNSQIKTGIEEEIIAMFDRLTEEHSWYPETQKNRHYYDGWATNKAHKIGKKVIIPCYGVFDSWDGKPRTYEARKVLEDIERILNFLDGNMTLDVSLEQTLEWHFKHGETKNVPLKYFKATFYKKGTVHLVFTCPELIERFNIYAAQNKAWLPPCYGRKRYTDMTEEEKNVIDGFQGEQAYNDIMAKANYYLAPVTNNAMLLLN